MRLVAVDSILGRLSFGGVAAVTRCSRRDRGVGWPALIATAALICAMASIADAANFTCSWISGSPGDYWTTTARWSNCNNTFPNNGGDNTYDAHIGSGGGPTLITAVTIGSATVDRAAGWFLSGSGASATLTGTLVNTGRVDLVSAATLTVAGGFTNGFGSLNIDSGANDGGGRLTVGGTLSNGLATGFTTTIGNTALSAPTTVTVGGLNNTQFSTTSLFGNAGNPAIQAQLIVNGQATNTYIVNIASAANVTVTGTGNAYTQAGPFARFTNMSGGTLAAPNINITSGSLRGTGTVAGATNISGQGAIEAIDLLTIDGNYAQSGGTFDALLHGTGVQINKVDVTAGHTVTLTGGDLELLGVTFTLGEVFEDIMTFQPGELIGTFATIEHGGDGTSVDLGNGLTLLAVYDNLGGDISLEVVATVPAPMIGRGVPVLLAIGGILFSAKLLECRTKRSAWNCYPTLSSLVTFKWSGARHRF